MAYHVFISYRRQGASELALLLYSKLATDGYRPFLDMESMRSGKFNTQLFERIDECKDVIVLLPENAFNRGENEEDWLRLEIAYALKNGKNVIPVFMRNFTWPAELPSDIAELRYRQGIEASLEYFDAVYQKMRNLISYHPRRKKLIRRSACAALSAAVIAGGIFISSDNRMSTLTASFPVFSSLHSSSQNAEAPSFATVPLASEEPVLLSSRSEQGGLKPYCVSFGDEIAIRLLNDGSIDATAEECEQAEWDDFKQNGSTWAVQYTDAEYKSLQKEQAIVRSFQEMQQHKDYIDVSAAHSGIFAAVHADGTVAFSKQSEWQYQLSADRTMWNDIKDIDLGAYTIVALKKDGSAICHGAQGSYAYKKGTFPWRWTDVVDIRNDHIAVGLRSDGTVYYADRGYEPFDPNSYIDLATISEWTGIVQVDTAGDSVVGLKADGTVVFAGDNEDGKCDTSNWTDIVKVAVGINHTVGLKKDGTLVSTKGWALKGGEDLTGVVDVYVNRHNTLAILKDGTCRLLGESPDEDLFTGSWAAGNWRFPVEPANE